MSAVEVARVEAFSSPSDLLDLLGWILSTHIYTAVGGRVQPTIAGTEGLPDTSLYR